MITPATTDSNGDCSGQPTIALIGAGAAGALTAYHLLQARAANSSAPRVVLIDPRPAPGLGLAYSTPSLRHLLNVPTGRISALPSDPDHLLRWVHQHHDPAARPFSFLPRAVFGRYLQSLYAQVAAQAGHIAADATDLHRCPQGGWQIALSDGRTLHAAQVVLATGNFDPAPLPNVAPVALAEGLYQNNAWSKTAFDGLPLHEATKKTEPGSITEAPPVALIGTGLTAVDVILRLRELGYTGRILCLSRRACFPERHVETPPAASPVITAETPRTALGYLRALRAAVHAGMHWRAAVDSIRSITNDLWLDLPLVEQRRLLRHLQRRWTLLRHRMAPDNADTIAAELAAGSLTLVEGSFAGLTLDTTGAATLTVRSPQGSRSIAVARVINCTGPSASYRNLDSPLIQSLLRQGLAAPGPFGAFNTALNGALIDASGHAATDLFTLGPGRIGNLFETIAMPEIRQQSYDLARTLLAHRNLPSMTTTHPPAAAIVTDAAG